MADVHGFWYSLLFIAALFIVIAMVGNEAVRRHLKRNRKP